MDVDERVVRARQFAADEHRRIMIMCSKGVTPTSSSILANLAIFSRIYIGSIRFDLTEFDIKNVFGQYGTIRSIAMVREPNAGRHRGYGFIEYCAPESAKMAQNLDDTELAGRSIKVGRPNNFPTELPPGIPKPVPTRVFVANLHELVQEEDLKKLFEPFGKILMAKLILPSSEQMSGGGLSGYIEYEKVSDAFNAINAMSTFELCGRKMRVCQTIIGGNVNQYGPDLVSSSTMPSTEATQNIPIQVIQAAQQLSIRAEKSALSSKPVPAPAVLGQTSIMALRNIISYNDLASFTEEESTGLQDEIQKECSNHGNVLRLILHGDEESQCVTAFVQYSEPKEVEKAIPVFHGRWFDGRVLSAEPFNEDRFIMRDL
jgi:RNA recognition motif-containing protein